MADYSSAWTRRGFLGSVPAMATAASALAQQDRHPAVRSNIKITDLRCAVIGRTPVVRIVTDKGISGYGQAESSKYYLKPTVLFYKEYLLGEDPTDVERVMLKIRRLGAFKPWGSAVSAIEIALWDIAGQAAGVPVYKLLGGKIRDRVRIYNGGFRPPFKGQTPQDYADNVQQMKEAKEGFTLIKMAVGFHNPLMMRAIPNMWYDEIRKGASHPDRGLMTERGLDYVIACTEAMKKVLGSEIGLTPYPNAQLFRDLKQATSVPIHTGEQIYLRQNFKDLIEAQAVDIVGPDPEDVGGIAELKWIAEYADLHGILVAPHGIFDGLIGLAAHVHLAATLPQNYIAFECPFGQPEWWYDIVEGLPDPVIKKGFIDVWDRPGLGVTFNVPAAKKRLDSADSTFFD
jgi:L-alanine-DL-glutamate epimerase-like enolase superfamily enzyme